MSRSWVRALSRVSPSVSPPCLVSRKRSDRERGAAGEVLMSTFGGEGRLDGVGEESGRPHDAPENPILRGSTSCGMGGRLATTGQARVFFTVQNPRHNRGPTAPPASVEPLAPTGASGEGRGGIGRGGSRTWLPRPGGWSFRWATPLGHFCGQIKI